MAFREDAREQFLADLRRLTREQRVLARRLMAEVRADPLTLRPGWHLLPFPWRPGTAAAVLEHASGDTMTIRFAVETDDVGAIIGIIWFRALVE